MNWITEFVRPKINSLLNRRETPDNLWIKCPQCDAMLFHRDLAGAVRVCTNCANHFPISPQERFGALFDKGEFRDIPLPASPVDPLNFRDEKRYTDRLKEARKKTGSSDAMLAVEGEIAEVPVVAIAQSFAFMGGSMGMAVGDAILEAAKVAIAGNVPLLLFSAAGGARMQEGILSLMQMPRTTIAIQMLREAEIPYICVLTHPTTGGVTASYAMLGDIQIAEPNTLICFAGPRVIEQTIREKLPDGFQRAEYLLEHGMLDMVVDRRDMRERLGNLLRLIRNLPPLPAAGLPAPTAEEMAASAGQDTDGSA